MNIVAIESKEPEEKIDELLWQLLERYVKDEPWKPETVFVLAHQIKDLFKSLGYRQIDTSNWLLSLHQAINCLELYPYGEDPVTVIKLLENIKRGLDK